jgi:ribosomal protein S13
VFLFGVYLLKNKRIDLSLRSCLGIGLTSGSRILAKLGCNLGHKKNILKIEDCLNLTDILSFLIRRCFYLKVGRVLENWLSFRKNVLKRIKSLRSYRHSLFLPVRGQRTRKNAEVQKSKRTFRKKVPIPLKKKKS